MSQRMNGWTRRQILKCAGALLTLVVIAFGFTNCGEMKAVRDFQSTSLNSDSVELGSPSLQLGKSLYSTNCATCHGDLENSAKLGKKYGDIERAISTQSAMTQLSFLNSTDIDAIAMALNAPVGNTDNGIVSSFRIPIQNRYLFASVLTDLFVVDSNKDASDAKIEGLIASLVTEHPEAFGGNCSRNDPNCIPAPCGLSGSSCVGNLDARQIADPDPPVSSTREGYTIQVCEQILAVDKAVKTLVTKAGADSDVRPNAATLDAIQKFIFPGQIASAANTIKLSLIAVEAEKAGLGPLDQWRFVLLPICESSALKTL